MSHFGAAVDRVLLHEGGYVHHPRDPGGATNHGITQRVARAHGYMGDMRQMPRAVAIEIYRKAYWSPIRGDELPRGVDYQVFDAAVNSGVRQATIWLQRASGAAADGIIGPRTIEAVRRAGAAEVMMRYVAMRLQFLASLSTWPSFGRGWARRAAGNLEYAASDL